MMSRVVVIDAARERNARLSRRYDDRYSSWTRVSGNRIVVQAAYFDGSLSKVSAHPGLQKK